MATTDETDMNETNCDGVVTGDPVAIFIYVIMTLTTILVVILNPLCLVVLRRASGIPDSTKTFMASLTVSDLCSGIFWGIPKLIEYTSEMTPALAGFLCVTFNYVAYFFVTMSILSLLLMTIDRYVAIVHSLHYSRIMTPRRSKIIVALVWAAVVVLQAAFAIMSESDNTHPCDSRCDFCDYTYICMVGTSLGIILVLYVHILKIARNQARRIAVQNHDANFHEGQNAPHCIHTKAATTVVIVAGSAFLCWGPQIVYSSLLQKNLYPCAIVYIAEVLFLTNGWLNVVIYYWRNRDLQEAMRRLITTHRS